MSTPYVADGESQLNDVNLEIFSIIWLDPNANSYENQESQQKLRYFINHLKRFDNKNECRQYIEQRSKDDRLIIIASGQFGNEVVPHIHQLRQVSSIYIYCMDIKRNELWARNFSKIKDVIVDSNKLISKIKTDQKVQMKIQQPWSINIFTRNTNEDVIKTKANNQFIYFQLLINCMIKMKFNQIDNDELMSMIEKEYQGNDDQLKIIDEFQKDYSMEKVLSWYICHSFFDIILNKALCVENIHLIFLYHSFISHLYSQLQQGQSKRRLQVFRSQILSSDELSNLRENLGQFISINAFVSANTDRATALSDFSSFKATTELQCVLFEIDADPKLTTIKPFALVDSQNESNDQSEVLFMAASIFSLDEITRDDDDQVWIVKMTLCTDEQYQSILNSIQIKKQNDSEQSNLRTLAKLLWKMDKLDLANYYYNRLINELPVNDPLRMVIYEDLAKMTLQKEDYDGSVQWFRKLIEIGKENLPPGDTIIDGSNTFIDYFPDLGSITHRPVCPKRCSCEQLNDEAHMRVFFHHLPCQFGGQCEHIDDEGHSKTYRHPGFCAEKALCKDLSESHLFKYRHLPICKEGFNCSLLIKDDSSHCTKYRHCRSNCQSGLYCNDFHNNEHIESKNHPFNFPCPYTPYMCQFHDKTLQSVEQMDGIYSSDAGIHHCYKYSHVCPLGRQCTDLANKKHIQSNIHIIRMKCPNEDNCKLLHDENHLNSYSHASINDIRSLCHNARSDCPDRLNPEHIKRFRHTGHFDHFSVSRYMGFSRNINFVQNQNEMKENIEKYLQLAKWNSTTILIPDDLKRWIRALQPIHRCNKLIFESILVHGHVMSRDHMNSLEKSDSVGKAIKQHTKVKRILYGIKNALFQKTCEEYIQMLVEIQFNQAKMTTTIADPNVKTAFDTSGDPLMKAKLQQIEGILIDYVTIEDIETVRKWTNEIAQASLQLHSSPTGIGFAPDQNFGTNKHVFGVLGPNMGYYYGDIIIVFRPEIMFHPDSNFSIQAATTFGKSMNAYRWRPWLKDPGSPETRIEHFHRTKLHCSIPSYEEAAAYELIALAGLPAKSTTDIDLKAIQERWLKIDSHCVFEAHLPQLIPLDYIDRVYIAQTTFDSLSASAQQSAKAIFDKILYITPHKIDTTIPPAGLHQPLDPTRIPYQAFVIDDICQTIEKRSNSPSLLQSTFITLPPSAFKDHINLPITISQSYNQYKSKYLSNSIYIYWEAFNGDMMLTLTNQIIDINIDQKDLQCLICYIAKWPTNNMIQNTTQPDYREDYSYIGNHPPIKHHFVVDDRKFKSSSNSFHRGCNTDDYIIYNLTINRTTNQVTLAIAGSNSIYNHHKINYTFNPTELDLNKLEYIQLSAGLQTVPIRNLIIRHEPIEQLHPSIDIEFINTNNIAPKQELPTKKVSDLCVNSIHCLLLYADSKEGKEHTAQYIHPCRFSELCRNKAVEPHLVHIPHLVPRCQYDEKCLQRGEPFHRAQFRHTNLPDYLFPCKYQQQCRTKSVEHRIKYSHGELIPLPSFTEGNIEKTHL